jgi:formylglycine-generating enzyme required for sulfatase activity
VTGATFNRTYVNDGDGGAGGVDPASVSSFRLDKYEVTVGRFRQFVAAWKGGWVPPPGSGKHTHVHTGQGLEDSSKPGTFEAGWVATDDGNVAPTDASLACDQYTTWTASAGGNENLPMSCANWFEAYAFCSWDGGFLPSDAEWEFAAAGGAQQREYPWGSTAPGSASQYAIYDCYYPTGSPGNCNGIGSLANVGTATAGGGAWGQLDLAGSVYEWTLDWYASFVDPCLDCAFVTPPSNPTPSVRACRGGSYNLPAFDITPITRNSEVPDRSTSILGFRCARTP